MTLKTAGIRCRDNYPLPDAFCEVQFCDFFQKGLSSTLNSIRESVSGEIEKSFLQDIVFSNKNFMPDASDSGFFLRFDLIIKSPMHHGKNKK